MVDYLVKFYCTVGMMQNPKTCAVLQIAPYFAVSASIVLLVVNLILLDSSQEFSNYHYFIESKRKHLLGDGLSPHSNTENLHTITELSEETLTPAIKHNSLKIFVYNLPTRFNYDLMKESKSLLGKFDNYGSTCNTQITLHRFFLTSNHRVHNPTKADFFYVPVYGSCHRHHPHMDMSHKIYNEALVYIKTHYPYFNSSYGRDHIWVTSVTGGAKKSTTWKLETKNCILLFCGIESMRDIDYIPYKDMVIAPDLGCYNFTPYYELLPLSVAPRRKYLVHVAGSSYVFKTHANNTRTTYYFRHLFPPSKLKVSNLKSRALLHNMMSSVFCLCPANTHGWSRMYYLSILLGCIPVLFGNENEVAFTDIIDPSKFTVQVQDVDKLKASLMSISHGHVLSLQNELKKIWQMFYYGSNGFATEAIVKSLTRKKTTSHTHYYYNSKHP